MNVTSASSTIANATSPPAIEIAPLRGREHQQQAREHAAEGCVDDAQHADDRREVVGDRPAAPHLDVGAVAREDAADVVMVPGHEVRLEPRHHHVVGVADRGSWPWRNWMSSTVAVDTRPIVAIPRNRSSPRMSAAIAMNSVAEPGGGRHQAEGDERRREEAQEHAAAREGLVVHERSAGQQAPVLGREDGQGPRVVQRRRPGTGAPSTPPAPASSGRSADRRASSVRPSAHPRRAWSSARAACPICVPPDHRYGRRRDG